MMPGVGRSNDGVGVVGWEPRGRGSMGGRFTMKYVSFNPGNENGER